MEIWDLLDANRRPTGRTHIRGQKVPAGRYWLVVGVWTVNRRGEILLTLRAPDKEAWPNSWENTGGSALTGETSRAAAVRELREETGIVVTEDSLTLLCETREEDLLNESGAFVDNWFAESDAAIAELTLQPGETVAAKWVSTDELEAMIARNEICAPVARRYRANREAIGRYCHERKHQGAE